MSKILKKVILIMIMIIIALATSVHAYSAEAKLTTSSKLEEGKEVTVTLKVQNIDATASGISVVKGKISYDTNVFESYTVETKNGWKEEKANSTFLFEKDTGVTANEEVAVIKLKVKESISKNEAQIKFTNITVSGMVKASGGPGDIKVAGATITVSKTEEAKIVEEDINKSKNIGTSKTKEDKIPFAGKNETILAIAGGFVLVAIIMNKRYRNIDR